MNLKQREAAVNRAIKNLDAAIDSMDQLDKISGLYGHKRRTDHQCAIRLEMVMKLNYWKECQWWKQKPEGEKS